jgi:hypothetical protein
MGAVTGEEIQGMERNLAYNILRYPSEARRCLLPGHIVSLPITSLHKAFIGKHPNTDYHI